MERLKRMRSSQSSEHKPSMAWEKSLALRFQGDRVGCPGQIIYPVSVLIYKVTFLVLFSVLHDYTYIYIYIKDMYGYVTSYVKADFVI